MQQAVVDRVHAIARAHLDQAGQHGEAALADAAADAVVHRHDLGGQHAAIGVNAGQQVLADDTAQAACQLGGNVVLLVLREGVKDTRQRARGFARVQRRNHQMPRFGRLDRGAHRLQIAQLGDHNHIRVLPQRALHGVRKGLRVAAHLALADQAALVFEDELDRVLNADDVRLPRAGDGLRHAAQRGGFAGARGARDQDQAIAHGREPGHGRAVAQVDQLRDRVRDVAEVCLDPAQHVAGIATEAAQVFHLHGEVQLPLMLQPRALAFLQHRQNQLARVIGVQQLVRQRYQGAVDARHGRSARAQMQVRATALDDHGKILDQIVGMHERKRKQKAEVSGGQDGRFAPGKKASLW